MLIARKAQAVDEAASFPRLGGSDSRRWSSQRSRSPPAPGRDRRRASVVHASRRVSSPTSRDFYDGELPAHHEHLRDVVAQATVHGYTVAFWWAAAIFAAGAIVCRLVVRRGAPKLEPDASPALAVGHEGFPHHVSTNHDPDCGHSALTPCPGRAERRPRR